MFPLTKPTVSPEEAKILFANLYGFTVKRILQFNSYDDQNFHIEVVEDHSNDRMKQQHRVIQNGFVMKISNSTDSADTNGLCWQNKVMQFLASNGFCVQSVIPSLCGKEIEMVELPNQDSAPGDISETQLHAVRLLTFLPGELLEVASEPSISFDEQIGEFMGKLTKCLQRVPNCQQTPCNAPLWSLSNVPNLRQYVPLIGGEQRRDLLTKVIDLFQENVSPKKSSLMQGLIHGDLNDHNILIRKVDPPNADQPWEICGIIDWQDLAYSYLVYDLAILIAYRMIALKTVSPILLEVAAATIRGYRSTFPELPLEDLKLLPILVISRLTLCICVGGYTAQVLQPDNSYVVGTAEEGWDQLVYLYNHLALCHSMWIQ